LAVVLSRASEDVAETDLDTLHALLDGSLLARASAEPDRLQLFELGGTAGA
jgi:hypothetical protein